MTDMPDRSTSSFSADPQDLAARLRQSQERLRDSYDDAPSPRTYRVWCACVALTAGWGKTADAVFVKVIEEQAGLAKGKASAPLRDLHEHGVIVWRKDTGQRTLGHLELPPVQETREQWFARVEAQARRSQTDGSQVPPPRTALDIFGEAEPSYLSDRERPHG